MHFSYSPWLYKSISTHVNEVVRSGMVFCSYFQVSCSSAVRVRVVELMHYPSHDASRTLFARARTGPVYEADQTEL